SPCRTRPGRTSLAGAAKSPSRRTTGIGAVVDDIREMRSAMTWVAGVDGCRAGWFVVLRQVNGRKQTVHHCLSCFGDVLKLSEKPDVIAVDIPIGLLDQAVRGGRDCDRGARSLLGHPRSSSVFSPPVRSALAYMTFATASAANRTSSPHQV